MERRRWFEAKRRGQKHPANRYQGASWRGIWARGYAAGFIGQPVSKCPYAGSETIVSGGVNWRRGMRRAWERAWQVGSADAERIGRGT